MVILPFADSIVFCLHEGYLDFAVCEGERRGAILQIR